jgi:hypothetical protein
VTERPPTGTELLARPDRGEAELGVRNGSDGDAVVKVVTMDASPSAVLAVYVRASEAITISSVPDIELRVAFARGTHWNPETSSFFCRLGAEQFEETFDFAAGDWDITLFGVVNGTAHTEKLDAELFDSY